MEELAKAHISKMTEMEHQYDRLRRTKTEAERDFDDFCQLANENKFLMEKFSMMSADNRGLAECLTDDLHRAIRDIEYLYIDKIDEISNKIRESSSTQEREEIEYRKQVRSMLNDMEEHHE
jgi:histone deacetylase complex regulatory component SIN3